MERSTLSARSRKLFTLSAIYTGTGALLQHVDNAPLDDLVKLATSFWEATATQFHEWQLVRERKMTAGEVRRDFIHANSTTFATSSPRDHNRWGRGLTSGSHRRQPSTCASASCFQEVRQFRSVSTARGRTAHLAAFFGRNARAAALTTYQIRQYQLARRAAGAATGTINRETSALHRMGTLAVHWGWLDTVPGFPDRLRENPPRQGFFEHPEYLAVRAHLPAPWQDILDVAYYSGWRKNEILGLTWEEIDMAGGVIRLSPARSKTLAGRILPISQPIAEALARRRARRDPTSPLVFHRDGIPVRRWRTAWRTACQAAGVPTRFLHDCRRTAARNLIRASVPERVAMLLTGHKSRAIFDRYNIIHEQELLDAGDQLVAYLAQQAPAAPARRRPHAVGPAAPLRLVRRGTA